MIQQDHISDAASQSGRAAIYARPAAGRQAQTTQKQLNTLIALANDLGYPNEQIIVYEDAGASTREPLAMRSALNDFLEAITQTEQKQEQKRIHSVIVSSPYRLFRDLTGVDIAAQITHLGAGKRRKRQTGE